MAKCPKCGAHVNNDDIFCPQCKTKIDTEQTSRPEADRRNLFTEGEDFSRAYRTQDVAGNKTAAVLCYLPLVCLYPILFRTRTSAYVRFHANQGLVLFLTEILFSLVVWLLDSLVLPLPVIGAILSLPLAIAVWALRLVFIALTVIGVYRAYTGRAKQLPLIGKITLIK